MTKRFINILAGAAVAAALLAGAGPGGAMAEEQARLRANVTVESELVTLGDLFEHAGPAAGIAVFRAPDLGKSGTVSVSRIAEAAKRHGVEFANPERVASVTVARSSVAIDLAAISQKIAEKIRARLNLADDEKLDLSLHAKSKAIHLPVDADADVRVEKLVLSDRNARFSAQVRTGADTVPVTYRGEMAVRVSVPVLQSAARRGDEFARAAIILKDMPRRDLTPDMIRDPEELAGMAARRAIPADRPVRKGDVEPPRLVRRNTGITIVYRAGALTITMHGRSLDDGAEGETVRILNLRSKKIIDGVVAGRDRVTVPAGTPALTAALANRATSRN